MRGSGFSRERRRRRSVARGTGPLAFAILVSFTGCYGSHMNHRGVRNPIFLGERMHIGEGPRFELAEKRETYRAQSLNAFLWAVLPTGDEVSDRDRKDAAARQANQRLGLSSYRAVRTGGVEVGSTSLFFLVFIGFHSSVEFYGELIEVIPPPEDGASDRPAGPGTGS